MRIASVTLCNFQCFGDKPITIKLSQFTSFIGNNGCGKTAILAALCRVFGPPLERRLRRTDFHVSPEKTLEDSGPVTLVIELRIAFPELQEEDEELAAAVPDCFRHMVLEEEGGTPFCRVRLEGTWTKAGLPDGEIEEDAWWIKTAADEVADTDKQKMKSFERGRILVLYVPAARDPAKHLRNASGTLLARLLDAVVWSKKATKLIEDSSAAIGDAFDSEAAIKLIHKKVRKSWRDLYDEATYANPRLRPVGERVNEVLQHIEMVFAPSKDGFDHDVERLSEGQRSLFYLSLVSAIFDVEQEVLKAALHPISDDSAEPDTGSISADRLTAATLTVFAVEEPENHLAPHYLGRIMELLERIASNPKAQVLVTTHSASALRRVSPQSIRYVRIRPVARTATVIRIKLPRKDTGEVYKYVKEAVISYPELYFGRLGRAHE